MNSAFDQLRQSVAQSSTRPFLARGSIVKRCPHCLMACFACFCPWRSQLIFRKCVPHNNRVHFVLLVHRNEIFKPTNSGRLIADLFPWSCQVFLWSRTEPDSVLLTRLEDEGYRTVILFPDKHNGQHGDITMRPSPSTLKDKRPLRVILLDGTWKQASKIANQSVWLQGFERMVLSDSAQTQQRFIRQAAHSHQLSTAQAAACVLREAGELDSASVLEHYFAVFNQHCQATRQNRCPEPGPSHHYLSNVIQNGCT